MLCGGRCLQPPGFLLYPPPPKIASFHLFNYPVPACPWSCPPAAAQNNNGISFFIFPFSHFSKTPGIRLCHGFAALTLRKLREISISRNYFRPVACNAVVSRLCGLSSITWNCASIASIAFGLLSGGGSTTMLIGCGSLPCSGASAGVSR